MCDAEPVSSRERDALAEWLDAGMQGSMGWFERGRAARMDIRTRYPWARSVVALRYEYAADRPKCADDSIASRVSRYALGRDYHEVLRERLGKLEAFIRRLGEEVADDGKAEARWYQDTGPVLEHVYAERAGIGWTGKHTLTLNENAGSYFFLAEIVTSLELPPDPPSVNHCGTCTACIDACPTAAIIEPYVLDARRCISYLTIEHKGAIASEFRDQFGGYLFGCDICQEVCPYNRKRGEREGPRLPAAEWRAPALEALTLERVLSLSDDALRERLLGTPLERTGAARIKRNAALLAGSERLASAFSGLLHCLTHPEPWVRESCAWALGRFCDGEHGAAARRALTTHQKRESEESVREAMVAALSALSGYSPPASQ